MDNLLLKEKVWFVTGASRGIGLTIVKTLLKEGYKVSATSRSKDGLCKAVFGDGTDIKIFQEVFLPLECKLNQDESVQEAIQSTLDKFGKIDVVINNAGYGLFGPIEDVSDREARDLFDINFFGALNVMRHSSPILRSQRTGYLLNISSIGGFFGWYGLGIYCSSKFAMDGITEAYAQEMARFGVKVSTLNLGSFESDFKKSVVQTEKQQTDEYQFNFKEIANAFPSDSQPFKLISILINLVEMGKDLPVHLFSGADSVLMANMKLKQLESDIKVSESLLSNLSK